MPTAEWLGYSASYFRPYCNLLFPSVQVRPALQAAQCLPRTPLTTGALFQSSQHQSLPQIGGETKWTLCLLEQGVLVL